MWTLKRRGEGISPKHPVDVKWGTCEYVDGPLIIVIAIIIIIIIITIIITIIIISKYFNRITLQCKGFPRVSTKVTKRTGKSHKRNPSSVFLQSLFLRFARKVGNTITLIFQFLLLGHRPLSWQQNI